MSKPYFLTRQTANLMEGFVRELQAQGGLYLIYGDQGVGKTRLLAELAGSRLSARKVRWIDLKAGGSSDGVLIDSSAMIEKAFARGKSGDVIVADHFEAALKKSRHQLFLSWSSDGLDKGLTLIVAASTEYFNEFRQLAQQYQVLVQSFEQLPFNSDEAVAFLGFYLFPDRSIAELSIPPMLRKQLAMAQGNVSKIIEIAERAGDQISGTPVNERKPPRRNSRAIGGVALALALLLGVSWYLLDDRQTRPVLRPGPIAQVLPASESVNAENSEASGLVEAEPGTVVDVVEADVAGETADLEQAIAAAPADAVGVNSAEGALPLLASAASVGEDAAIRGEVADETAGAPPDEPIATVDPLPASAAIPARQDASDSGGSAQTVDGEATAAAESASAAAVGQAATGSTRLQQDLQTSLDWITTRASQTGTLQIMLLSKARFDERVYYEHIDNLASRGVDVSSIRIFESYTGKQAVLSVVYGEYPSRAAAADARQGLPPVLRKDAPIARSVGGLMVEIQRLKGQN